MTTATALLSVLRERSAEDEQDACRPQWIPYAPVDDLDEALRRAVELGATMALWQSAG